MGIFFLIFFTVILFVLSRFEISFKIFKYKKRFFVIIKIFMIRAACFVLDTKNKNILRYVKKNGVLKEFKIKTGKKIDKDLISAVIAGIKIKEVSAKAVIGMQDAHSTAVICWILYFLSDLLISKILKINSNIKILPCYTKEDFSIDINCILKINFVNSIIRYLIKIIVKAVKKYESGPGSYADNNVGN